MKGTFTHVTSEGLFGQKIVILARWVDWASNSAFTTRHWADDILRPEPMHHVLVATI